MAPGSFLNLIKMLKMSACNLGSGSAAPFKRFPRNSADASNTVLVFVVVLPGCTIGKMGSSHSAAGVGSFDGTRRIYFFSSYASITF